MLQVIPSTIVASEGEWVNPRHLVVLNRGPTTQRVAVLTKVGRFSISNADEFEFTAYSSPCEHIVFEVLAKTHRKLLVQSTPRARIADDRVPGLIPVVCLGVPDTSVIACVWFKCADECGTAQLPWGSPAAQLLHKYEVSEERILQLLRQGMHAVAPQVEDSVAPSDEAPAPRSHEITDHDSNRSKEVLDLCMTQRQNGASQSCAAGLDAEYSTVECLDQLDALVFQAVQIEVEGRHAVVKRVMPVPRSSCPSSRLRNMASRTSSRASASSMAASCMSAASTASFQVGGKWYDARGNLVTPSDDGSSGQGRMSVDGTQSMCGPKSRGEEATCSAERLSGHAALQDRPDTLKSAALAAATAELGLSELPEPAFFRTGSLLPAVPSQQCASSPSAQKDMDPKYGAETEVTHEGKSAPKQGSAKQGEISVTWSIGASQLTQSQLDANWDAL